LLLAVGASAQTYVNPGESIQAAIDVAGPYDTILVNDGTYVEDLQINVAGLTLRSVNLHGAIIQTAGTFSPGLGHGGITIMANGVTIEMFKIEQSVVQAIIHTHNSNGATIKNNHIEYIGAPPRARGVDVGYASANSDAVTLEGNTFENLYCGVYINQASELTVNGNHFEDMDDGGLVFDGTWAYDGIVVTDNSATGANHLLYFYGASGTVQVTGNGPLVNTILSNWPVYNATQFLFYQTIQPAINAAIAGAEIQVFAGTYTENVSIPNTQGSVKLIGAGALTTIWKPATSAGTALTIGSGTSNPAMPVHVEGFTFEGEARGTGSALIIRASGTYANPSVFKDNVITKFNNGLNFPALGQSYWNIEGGICDESKPLNPSGLLTRRKREYPKISSETLELRVRFGPRAGN
jgi:pectin methylesterase-like acyl-CoA thioesterase